MGFSPLAQAVIVAVLAYASGLFLGLSARRGELRLLRLRARAPAPRSIPAPLNLSPSPEAARPAAPVTETSAPLARAAERLARAGDRRTPHVEAPAAEQIHASPGAGDHDRRRTHRHGRRRSMVRKLRDALPDFLDNARRYAPLGILLAVLVAVAIGVVTLVLDIQASAFVSPR